MYLFQRPFSRDRESLRHRRQTLVFANLHYYSGKGGSRLHHAQNNRQI
jgi:hypothetical protein